MNWIKNFLLRLRNTRYLYAEFVKENDVITLKGTINCTESDIAFFINSLCKNNKKLAKIISKVANRSQEDIDNHIF